MTTPLDYVKTVLVGRPKTTAGLEHERLTKKLALAVFSSDALSSSAYATEEMLLVLLLGGSAILHYALPLSLAITLVLGIVIFSYRQTVQAYPKGASAYIVASDNLGKYPGLVAASALLIDYVLTVAVSIAAGVAAVVSAVPEIHTYRVPLAIASITLVTLLNLRGVRESGIIFAVPTYAYILLIGSMVVWGLIRYYAFGYRAPVPPAVPPEQALTVFLLLKTFSHGSTALTGVEAISDGVQAFREPVAKNAATTLVVMGVLLGTLFVGLTALSHLFHVWGPEEDPHRTVVSLIAVRVYGDGSPLFYAVQAATALILFLAANTSFADFPRLSAFLARDRYAPRQLMNRGDRLAFSNGIIALGAFASLLTIIYKADVSRLINLYVVGVFTSFTLSQLGMVQHWRESRHSTRTWRRSAAVNALGATTTFVVLCIVLATKFLVGAWLVVAAVPLLVLWLNTVNRHYRDVAVRLRDPARRPRRARNNNVIMLVGFPSEEEQRALAYAQLLRPSELRCVHIAGPKDPTDLVGEWGRLLAVAPSLEIIPARTSVQREIRTYVEQFRSRVDPSDFVTVIVPERIRPGIGGLLESRRPFLVKASLLFTKGVVVTNVPYQEEEPQTALEPGTAVRHVVILLVSAVHNATLQALGYARTLAAGDLRAIHVSVDPDETARVAAEWEAWSPGVALEVVDSPYRELSKPLQEYVRSLASEGRAIVTIVLPEFTVQRLWHHLLHNQSAAAIKRTFLYEPNVIVTSVPYRLD